MKRKKRRKKKMAKMLMKTTDVYRVDDETEAIEMIETFRDQALTEGYTLTKSGYVIKTKKSKGEVVDSWAIVTIEKTFNE